MSVYLIDHVGSVSGGQHSDVPELLDAVHLRQELSQDPVAYAAGARGAGREDGNARQMSGHDQKRRQLMMKSTCEGITDWSDGWGRDNKDG